MEHEYLCKCVTPGEHYDWRATDIHVTAANADVARERAYAISGGAIVADVVRVED